MNGKLLFYVDSIIPHSILPSLPPALPPSLPPSLPPTHSPTYLKSTVLVSVIRLPGPRSQEREAWGKG